MTEARTAISKRLAGTLAFLLAVSVFSAGARTSDKVLYFNHLKTTNSGLSFNCVHAVIQDSRGFIWLGTSDGLNRFDGINFRTYRKEELGLNSCFIISLCEDNAGNIWVGTDSGATLYDLHSDRFRPFEAQSDIGTTVRNKVTTIKKDRQGVIWMAVNRQGLFAFDPRSCELKNYFVEHDRQTLPADITSFCFDMNNECWLALYFTNLYRADKELKRVEPVAFGQSGQLFRGDNVIEILESPHNTLYVTTVDKGTCEIAPLHNKIKTLIRNEKGCVPESMFFDRNGVLWVATTQGVVSYDTTTGETLRLTADPRDKFSLSDRHALAVFIDDSDGLWVGTDAGGVSYSGLFQRNFDKYHMAGEESLANSLVRGFTDDGEGKLWIATEKAGLLTYSPKTRRLSRYAHPRLPETLLAIRCHEGRLWLGSLQGVYRLDPQTGALRIYSRTDQRSGLRDNKIHAIARTSRDELLIGTTVGMLRYDPASDGFVPMPGLERMFVTDIAEDAHGNLWIATYANGLIHYDPKKQTVLRNYVNVPGDPRSLPGNKVLAVFRDSAGQIWATTFGAGFCRYDNHENAFRYYCQATCGSSVPSDICYKIIEDDQSRLWVSTHKGLICLTPETDELKVYTTADGLLNDEFYYNAGFRLSDGTLFFGSVDGFVRFDPREFHVDTKLPRIVITDLRIDDRIVRAGDRESPLACNIDRTQRLALSARQNSVAFGFALPGFASPASNTILCRLEGYDTQWRRVAADNTVSYPNLPAGSYTLRVMGANNNGLWNEEHPPLRITVARPFYKSTAAVLLYAAVLCATGILTARYYNRKAVERERLRQQEYKRAKEIELMNEKMTFFSNIVHEIKTPLTLIRTPLQNILTSDSCGEAAREDLLIIDHNAEYLSRLVKELLDFVHIEYHGYILECREMDIVEKVGFLCFNFSETARSNGIRLTFRHSSDEIRINADEPGLNKILNNLLHNAVKYAQSYIEVSVREQGEQVVVSFRNDGPIIPSEQRSEIFKPFVQYGNDNQTYAPAHGIGIGLSLARKLAELHGGGLVLDDDAGCTDFVLTLPLRRNAGEPVPAPGNPEQEADEDTALPVLLVVEDNAELASYLRRKLRPDYRIRTVTTAEQALELLRHQEIDLLITDISLQGMSGLELCRRVCSNFEFSHIPVIILSALSSAKSKVMGMECGASHYIEKPFNTEYLRACIRSIIDRRPGREKGAEASGRINRVLPQYLYDQPTRDTQFLERLDAVIVENLSDPDFSNEQLAEALYLSKSTLNRKMKGLLGTTPNDYIRTKRLVIAARMLTENRGRINEVCYSVGFNTPSYFAKCFKKFHGMLPAEYLKEHQADNA